MEERSNLDLLANPLAGGHGEEYIDQGVDAQGPDDAVADHIQFQPEQGRWPGPVQAPQPLVDKGVAEPTGGGQRGISRV